MSHLTSQTWLMARLAANPDCLKCLLIILAVKFIQIRTKCWDCLHSHHASALTISGIGTQLSSFHNLLNLQFTPYHHDKLE